MSMPTEPLAGRTLLGVFAHPDDESLVCGGLLAWCAGLGARVVLLCASRGEHGPNPDPAQPLAVRRAAELDAAARALGVSEVVLLAHEDGMLSWVDQDALDTDIRDAILHVRPDVIVTFDEDGLYWHPDHVAIHERTTAVVAGMGAAAPALYYATTPPGAMRAVHDAAVSRSPDATPLTILGIANPDAFGSAAPVATLILDVSAHAARKLAAIQCHRSQLDRDAFAHLTDADAPGLLGREHYRRAAIGALGDTFLDHLTNARITA